MGTSGRDEQAHHPLDHTDGGRTQGRRRLRRGPGGGQQRTHYRRSWRLLAAAGFTVPIVVGAMPGYQALRDAPQLLTLSVLAFTGGPLLSVAVEEMIPQAHEESHSRQDAFYLVTGFAAFAAVSTYLPT